MLTFNIELSSKADRTGRWSVMIRLCMKGHKPARVLTSVKVANLVKFWKSKEFGKWVKGHPNAKAINQEVEEEYDRIRGIIRTWQKEEPNVVLVPQQIAERIKYGSSEKYFDWIDQVLDDCKRQAFTTYINKKSAANAFRAWAGEDLPLKAVTPYLVRKFQDHLIKDKRIKKEGCRKASTINKRLVQMHVLHQQALIKSGISPKQAAYQSPWNDVVKVTEVKPKKAKLNQETIDVLATIRTTSKRKCLLPEEAFQVWQLARLLAGIRFADVIQLRYRNFTLDSAGKPIRLRYEMLKTGSEISIPVLPEAAALLAIFWKPQAIPTDYVLPFLDSKEPFAKLLTHEAYKLASFDMKRRLYSKLNACNIRLNRALRILEKSAGLSERMTTHTARHSFAVLAKRIMKEDKTITLYDIQMMLGHSDHKTTKIYTDELDAIDTNDSMQAIFNRPVK